MDNGQLRSAFPAPAFSGLLLKEKARFPRLLKTKDLKLKTHFALTRTVGGWFEAKAS